MLDFWTVRRHVRRLLKAEAEVSSGDTWSAPTQPNLCFHPSLPQPRDQPTTLSISAKHYEPCLHGYFKANWSPKKIFLLGYMEQNFQRHDDELKEEEYVLMDLDSVSDQISIPPNAPYVLSGLDTLNPILTIDGKIKLVGEYVETIGTCLVFGDTGEPYYKFCY
nr:general transcription factor 3C polypeptide 6-like isoform X1 [Ipomoea batatas]